MVFISVVFVLFFRFCDCLCVVEVFCGKFIVEIVCGGFYSVCIIGNGELYMWGKGCYGWLGYGDSED